MMKTKNEMWAQIINDARWYDGTPNGLVLLTEHFEKLYDLNEKPQHKKIPDFIPVRIERYLHESGWKPYSLSVYPYTLQKKHDDRKFNTLKGLKEYFGIKKVSKIMNNDRGWAINTRGKKIEWDEYNAEISKDFIL